MSASVFEQVRALREGAGVWARPELFTLQLTGPDRVRFLNGMVSNDVEKLRPGQFCWAVKTTAKGRVEGLVRVRAAADKFLLDVHQAAAEKVALGLVNLLVADDCALTDHTDDRRVLACYGPRAPEIVASLGPVPAGDRWTEGSISVVPDDRLGVPGFEIHLPLQATLDLTALGATPVTPEAYQILRIEAGLPEDGADLNDVIPLEANLQWALSFEKGCYVGQEVIARAHNLGGVKHGLVSLTIEGAAVPSQGAQLWVDGKQTGELTSVVLSPGGVIALGYVRKQHQNPGAVFEVRWDQGSTNARLRA